MKNLNVIFLLIDGARVDRIHEIPIFQELKKQGTFFSHMITHAPYTLVSMNSIFTGMYGGKNGIDAYFKMFQHPKENCKTLGEYLQKNNWNTVGDTMRLSLVSNRGFDTLTSQEDKSDPNFVDIHKKIIDQVTEMQTKNPFFLYLHYPKIHHDIKENVFDVYDDFSEEYFKNKEKNLKNYDSYLIEAGKYLKSIYETILAKNLDKNSIIIVMADHGMGVGEKIGERAYGVFTYDYSIRTFAYFLNSDIFPKGKEINKLTETIDIMPTILDCLEIPVDPSSSKMQGVSLLSEIKNSNNEVQKNENEFDNFAFSETGGLLGPWPSPDFPNVKCIRTEKWKLIHNLTPDTWELYDLKHDPNENDNLYGKFPDIAALLKEKLKMIEEDCKK